MVKGKEMSDLTETQELEQASLLKGRYYLILEPLYEGDDASFAVRAYSTREFIVEDEGEEVYDPTYVVLQGLLGLINDDFDAVYEAGLERVTLEAIAHTFEEDEIDATHLKKIREMEGNVITVDFGEVQ
jgi:hypothetical protein